MQIKLNFSEVETLVSYLECPTCLDDIEEGDDPFYDKLFAVRSKLASFTIECNNSLSELEKRKELVERDIEDCVKTKAYDEARAYMNELEEINIELANHENS
jgi:hypothetical protein